MCHNLENIEAVRAFLKNHKKHCPTIPCGPGLGLGGRMGSLASSSAMIAIGQLGIQGSAIQCSVYRELAPESLQNKCVLADYKGVGRIPIGHTGMTIQGQFLSAIQDRVKKSITTPYVADADHIPLRGDKQEHLAQFEMLVSEARDRTLFTIDPHFCINDNAKSPADKFSGVLSVLKKANEIVFKTKGDDPFRIEISIDECSGITTEAELRFLVEHLKLLKMPVFSIAPSLGFDKKDKDVSDEHLRVFAKMLKAFHKIASDYGILLGIHSGDGKSARTLQIIAECTNSEIWYKISPDRQRMFFKVLSESSRDSEEYIIFKEALKKLESTLLDNSYIINTEIKVQILNNLSEFKTSDDVSAGLAGLRDLGFLVVKSLVKRFSNVSPEFCERFYLCDKEYISEIAKNLGLLSSLRI